MRKALIVGSLNVDMTFNVENFVKKGETIFAKSYYESCGGKGANQAVCVSKLGTKTEMLGMVGFDKEGEKLISNLENFDIKCTILKSNFPTGRAIISVDKNADNSIIVVGGANLEIKKDDIDNNIESIKNNDIIILQNEIPEEVVEYTLVKAKENHKLTIYNPAPAKKVSEKKLENTDYLVVNETEMEFIFEQSIKDENYLENLLKIKKEKDIKNIILTLGEKGVVLFDDKNDIKKYAAYKVNAVDTTAAGDSFIGAFASKILDTNIDEAIKYAIAVSAIVVTRKGAQESIPTLDEIYKFIKENEDEKK
ncbi:ribokinase [Oceanivirga miroungae]|uniref:Ribokinase n=1 Tax=Oceanivirga miroungae TaxID=1130046 RepID=A0A6I8MC48_9FUSO|nr:ribokinase [Oceanivirga miroungae]VWL85030.1 ribokinase [Oceanivirga miroungae]